MSFVTALVSSSPLHVALQPVHTVSLDPPSHPLFVVSEPPQAHPPPPPSIPPPLHVVLQPTQIVVPSEPTPETTLYLDNIDRLLLYTVETIHLFAADQHRSSENVAQVLRDGLSRLLAGPYHFLAGRLEISPDGRPQIRCNSHGALFAEATASCSIADLGDVSNPSPEFKKLVLQFFDVKSLGELPLLLIQVTRFSCGGFCIGLGSNHAAMDGVSAAHFMQNYASVVRGEGLLIEPYPDRTCLKVRSPLRVDYDHDEFIKLSDLPPELRSSFTGENFGREGSDVSGNMRPSDTHIFRSFLFSTKELNCLKKIAMEDGVVSSCSSFDVVTAHLWKLRAQVTALKPDQRSAVYFAVDIRNRMKPPLHPNFCGNAIFSACATATAGELSEMPLSRCVKRIQEAVAAVTDDYVRSALDWGELNPAVPAITEGCFFVAAWWKLRFDSADFGWGKPIYCGPVVNGRVEFILLLPSTSRDSCRLYLALEPPQMAKFEELLYPKS